MARRGRRSKGLEARIEIVEGKTIDGCLQILSGKDEDKKFALIKDLAGKVLARRVKVGGDAGNEVPIRIVFRSTANLSQPQTG